MTIAAKKALNSTLAEEALERLELKFISFSEESALTPTQVKEAFAMLDEAAAMIRHLDRLPKELQNRAILTHQGLKMMMFKFRRP